jgi:hypothetical protein
MCPKENNARRALPHLFNLSYIKENTHNYEHFRLRIEKIPHKGLGVLATRRIPKNRTIMYYRTKVYSRPSYLPLSDRMYSVNVYDKKEDSFTENEFLVSDIFEGSNPKPKGRKPFWVNMTSSP